LAWEEKNADKLTEGMRKTSVLLTFLVSSTLIALNILMWKLGLFAAMDSLFSNFKLPNTAGSINPVTIVQEQSAETENPFMPSLGEMLPNKPPNMIIKFIINIIGMFLLVVAAVFIMYGIFTVIVRVKSFFIRLLGYNNVNEKRESILKENELKNNLSRGIATFRRNALNIIDLSNRKKIRKLYKSLVKRHKSKGIAPEKHYTAGYISSKIEGISNRSYKEATEIYYRARYGKDECSEQEYKEAKKLYN
jgi:hypothetical protein